ncbi:MAG: 1-phosphofructokinase family hexose kinase, partial [Anaerolineae bacterium]|nr:1-phosphofructokinase family hexose kinase [Anaerolineae bacterium]
MILTVTANTTLDYTLTVPRLAMYQTIRATDALYSMGGKPTDASWILGELGIPSHALGFAAGVNGKRVEDMLRTKGVTPEFIQVNGETRVCVVIIVADGSGQTTITTNMMDVEDQHVRQLRTRYIETLNEATIVVIGGTLPRGMHSEFYTDFIQLARERNIPVIFDAAEPNLSAGLQSHPTYIKPNQDELSGFAGTRVETLDDAYRAGRVILERYGTSSIITLGDDGGLAVLPDKAYRIPPLNIPVVSTSGAGDAVLAGMTAALYRGQPVEEGLRWGFAAAGAVVMTPGTADCKREDVE